MICLITFHFLEFFSTAVSQPSLLSYDSYIINHSPAYSMAAMASWLEFWLESLIFGTLKQRYSFMLLGLLFIVAGQLIRTMAMWTCGEHFSHIIMVEKTISHKLITTGVYSVLRHPAYFGWFYWSIGTQLLLCNPLCTIAYTIASWSFFFHRIPFEESLLLEFYPSLYLDYSKSTIIGIPFIKSATVHSKSS
jgi:protein-S-isoprenylcysteine O-methyltransferase